MAVQSVTVARINWARARVKRSADIDAGLLLRPHARDRFRRVRASANYRLRAWGDEPPALAYKGDRSTLGTTARRPAAKKVPLFRYCVTGSASSAWACCTRDVSCARSLLIRTFDSLRLGPRPVEIVGEDEIVFQCFRWYFRLPDLVGRQLFVR